METPKSITAAVAAIKAAAQTRVRDLEQAHTAQQKKLDYVLSNSFGFGGTNASIVLGRV